MLATLLAAMGFAGCNSEKEDIATVSYSSVAVEGFSLAADDSVLANLDSVFFTIDLNNALIFNADSLPVGTDVSKLVVKVNTTSVGGVERRLETHIFDFRGELYGRWLRVELLEKIRDERRFASVEELRGQIARDKEYILGLK